MDKQKVKSLRRSRRRAAVRTRVNGTPSRPRLSVFRSAKHIYAQVIDDMSGKTLAAASTRDKEVSVDNTGNTAAAAAVGKALAERAGKAGITEVAFDRGGFKFHGRVKALADAAREGGLKF